MPRPLPLGEEVSSEIPAEFIGDHLPTIASGYESPPFRVEAALKEQNIFVANYPTHAPNVFLIFFGFILFQ